MKILSIGNSYSQDSQKWLHQLAQAHQIDLKTVNLCIGGCSLETHWHEYEYNNVIYDLEINGSASTRKISLSEALKSDSYDIITLQQASRFSGISHTYYPYIVNLADVIRKLQPQAKLMFIQTWAYEIDGLDGFVLDWFDYYHKNQGEMYRRICDASVLAGKLINAQVIPVGQIIQTLRTEVKEFDYAHDGISLCRDGFHLTLDYGRFAAAATMFRAITGKLVETTQFENFDENLIRKIISVVNS